MENTTDRITYWVLIVFEVLVGITIVGFVAYPLIVFDGFEGEFRFFLRTILLLAAIQTFAVLRLYNSIVQNTRFVIKLREALVKAQQHLPALDRSLRSLNASMSGLKSTMDANKKSLADNTTEITELSRKLQK